MRDPIHTKVAGSAFVRPIFSRSLPVRSLFVRFLFAIGALSVGAAGAAGADPSFGFAAPVVYDVGSQASSITAGDLDGDGDIDLVTANFSSADLSLLFNNGDGSFAPEVRLSLDNRVTDVVITDFNGDGVVDLLVSSASGPAKYEPGFPQGGALILLGLGGGAFGDLSHFSAGGQPQSIDAGDLDGDGDVDFVVSNQNTNNISVFLNNGDGTPAPSVFYPVGNVPQRLGLADMDSDGDLDVVVVNLFSSDISVLLNDGLGAFTPLPPVDTPSASSWNLSIGDINGDQLPDVALVNGFDSTLLVHFNIGGRLGEPVLFDAILNSPCLTLADIDGDSATDAAAAGIIDSMTLEPGFVRVVEGDGLGDFELVNELFPAINGNGLGLVTAADLDHDGDMDLAIVYPVGFTSKVSILLNQPRTPNVGDLNHDHIVDGADLALLLQAWGDAGAGDLNGDGVVNGSDLARLLVNWTNYAPPSQQSPTTERTQR